MAKHKAEMMTMRTIGKELEAKRSAESIVMRDGKINAIAIFAISMIRGRHANLEDGAISMVGCGIGVGIL